MATTLGVRVCPTGAASPEPQLNSSAKDRSEASPPDGRTFLQRMPGPQAAEASTRSRVSWRCRWRRESTVNSASANQIAANANQRAVGISSP